MKLKILQYLYYFVVMFVIFSCIVGTLYSIYYAFITGYWVISVAIILAIFSLYAAYGMMVADKNDNDLDGLSRILNKDKDELSNEELAILLTASRKGFAIAEKEYLRQLHSNDNEEEINNDKR